MLPRMEVAASLRVNERRTQIPKSILPVKFSFFDTNSSKNTRFSFSQLILVV